MYHPSKRAGRLRPSQPAQTSGHASHHTSSFPQPLRDPAVALAGISSPGRQFRGHGKQVGPSSRSLQGVAGGKAQEVALLGASISHSPCSASCAVWSLHVLGGLLRHSPPRSNPTAHSFSAVIQLSNTTLPFLASGPLHRLLLLSRMSFPCLLSSSYIWFYFFIFQVSS